MSQRDRAGREMLTCEPQQQGQMWRASLGERQDQAGGRRPEGFMCFSCILIPQLGCARGDRQGPAGTGTAGWGSQKRDTGQGSDTVRFGLPAKGHPFPGERRLSPQHPLEERGYPALGFRESLDPWTEPLLFLGGFNPSLAPALC